MKIINIKQIKGIYYVTIEPGFIARLFGAKTRVERFRDGGRTYWFGGGTVYSAEDGSDLPNGSKIAISIDNWRRRF